MKRRSFLWFLAGLSVARSDSVDAQRNVVYDPATQFAISPADVGTSITLSVNEMLTNEWDSWRYGAYEFRLTK